MLKLIYCVCELAELPLAARLCAGSRGTVGVHGSSWPHRERQERPLQHCPETGPSEALTRATKRLGFQCRTLFAQLPAGSRDGAEKVANQEAGVRVQQGTDGAERERTRISRQQLLSSYTGS